MKGLTKTTASAFTLVEILVVVGALAVLLSLSIVGMRSMAENAKSVQCMSDLRQTGVALNLYANDNNGFLPEVYVPHSPWTWPFALQQGGYFPKQWGSSPLEVPSCRANPKYAATYTYGMNDFLTEPNRRFKLAAAKAPSRTLLVADSLCTSGSPSNAYRVGDDTSYGRPAFVHKNTFNCLFWDGHVENMRAVPTMSSRLDNPFWNFEADVVVK